MNNFLILTGIPQKAAKGRFLFTLEILSKWPLHFGLPLEGKCINRKKLNMWTF